MKIRYQVALIDNNPNWSKPRQLTLTTMNGRNRANKLGGPYRVKKRGEKNWGKPSGLPDAMSDVRRRLFAGDVGDMILLQCDSDKRNSPVIGFRKVHRKRILENVPPVPACTPQVADIWREVWAKFGGKITSWGICNCRKIAGSTSWSQHAWCNAWDIHGSVGTMSEVAHFLMANRDRLQLAAVLWQGRNLITGNSVDDHFDHVHTDPKPTKTGTPPCA